jgi:hypothetical protein
MTDSLSQALQKLHQVTLEPTSANGDFACQLVLRLENSYPEIRITCDSEWLKADYLGMTFSFGLASAELLPGLQKLREWLNHKFPGYQYQNLYPLASLNLPAEV